MPTKPIARLMFAQGGKCFFCRRSLPLTDASIEHLVATANGGTNVDENRVVCCKSLNALLGRMSIKEKFQVVLNQKGAFTCPNERMNDRQTPAIGQDDLKRVITDLRKRGKARPSTVVALTSSISNLFKKSLSPEQLSAIVDELKARGIVVVKGKKIEYELPAPST